MFITKKELAAAYCEHPNTISRKLKALGVGLTKKPLTPKEVGIVFEEWGKPKKELLTA